MWISYNEKYKISGSIFHYITVRTNFSAELKRIAEVWTVSDLSAAARYGEYYAYY